MMKSISKWCLIALLAVALAAPLSAMVPANNAAADGTSWAMYMGV